MDGAIGLITTNYSTSNSGPLTASRPAAAIPIAGRYRMVDFILSTMVNSGLRTVGMILPVNYRSLIDHVGSGKDWSLDRKQGGLFMLPGSFFGSTRAGARFLIRDLVENKVYFERAERPYVILAAANIVLNIDLQKLLDVHKESGADITVACKTATSNNASLMRLKLEEGRATSVSMGAQPGDTISLDCCVMEVDELTRFLEWYQAVDYLDLFEALNSDLGHVDVRPCYYEDPALAVFSSRDYYDNSMRFFEPEINRHLFDPERPIYTKGHDVPPAKYEPGASVANAMVSGGSRIRGTVEESILGRSVTIEAGAVVRRSIIMQDCVVESGAHIEHAIIDRDNIIAASTEFCGTPENVLIRGKGKA